MAFGTRSVRGAARVELQPAVPRTDSPRFVAAGVWGQPESPLDIMKAPWVHLGAHGIQIDLIDSLLGPVASPGCSHTGCP